ncbi:MAG TPA: hypothetical protein DDW41_03785 [Candidatus Andersenbacteria bacterium]|nr:MAG: hypothetical protein A3B76_02260 [Candidatus Andersenbacteria bacterium RIFCSPHIGHO2_02_FULL_46_16]HBE90303.1 hypothetical protein [Candidatus Andersenbacteria bacterium]
MNKTLSTLLGVVGVLVVTLMVLVGGDSKAADIVFTGRGIVKSGGASNSINVYWTVVPDAVERIRGVRSDVNTSNAKKYKWEVAGGSLIKRRTTSQATPGKEVVIKGTLRSDDRVTGVWVVQNYRQFKLEGKIQGRTLDTGKTDEGWLTVNVTSSKLNNLTATTKFKESTVKGKDLRIKVNGQTSITALGKSKNFDEVTAGQQNVTIEGEVIDEDSWVASKVNERS